MVERFVRDTLESWVADFEHGDASGFSGITLDVTDAMQAGIARQETADRLSRTLLALKAGVWELDLIRNVAYWSDENFRVFGLEPRSVAPSKQSYKTSPTKSWLSRKVRKMRRVPTLAISSAAYLPSPWKNAASIDR